MAAGKPYRRNIQYERDAMHLLPLELIPFASTAFRDSLLIKNIQLESAVEVFRDAETGSGQVNPSQIKRYLPAGGDIPKEDLSLLAHLALMQSFDVYSVRIHLRQRGFDVNAIEGLRLSQRRQKELDSFMVAFTRPLAVELVGLERAQKMPASDLLRFALHKEDPEFIGNVRRFAKRLSILLPKLPDFIESYGDVFLSIAYFENEYSNIRPHLYKFLEVIDRAKEELKNEGRTGSIPMLERVEKSFVFAARNVEERIRGCHLSADALWRDLSLEKFERTRLDVESNHIALGALLCGLAVKVRGWHAGTGSAAGNALRIADLVQEVITPGLKHLLRFELSAQANSRRRQAHFPDAR